MNIKIATLVFAVLLHDTVVTSSDAVFATSLTASHNTAMVSTGGRASRRFWPGQSDNREGGSFRGQRHEGQGRELQHHSGQQGTEEGQWDHMDGCGGHEGCFPGGDFNMTETVTISCDASNLYPSSYANSIHLFLCTV
jgi:hypothetical protein